MAETVPDTAGALPRQHQQVAAAPDDGAVVAVAGAPDASAVTYTHIKGTMASIAAGLQLLHAARAAASEAEMNGERHQRIEALFQEACQAFDPLYRGLHEECADLLQCMLDSADST